MASRFSSRFMRLTAMTALGLALTAPAFVSRAEAQTIHFAQPYQDEPSTPSQHTPAATSHGGEHFHSTGRRPPPGYQDIPEPDFQNGPDPDHQAKIRSNRDSVTGANLGAFGNAYQDSNPAQSGQMGDATGNGWVAPRGNGF